MNMSVEKMFDCESDAWVSGLPCYQQRLINQLYSQNNDYEQVAKSWLQGSLSMTEVFGTEKGKSVYFEKILDEIELFLKEDVKYQDIKLDIQKQTGAIQSYIVGLLSVAMAPTLGNSAVFLAPVIAICFIIIGKIGVNAWLEMREDKHKDREE